MSSSLLTEYRCTCAKLLFKGFLCQGIVEIKCRRCGTVRLWNSNDAPVWSFLECNTEGTLVEVSGDVERIFGYTPSHLLGKQVSDFLPLARDVVNAAIRPGTYQIQDATLVLRDGKQATVATCVVPRVHEGDVLGYRIYGMPKPHE